MLVLPMSSCSPSSSHDDRMLRVGQSAEDDLCRVLCDRWRDMDIQYHKVADILTNGVGGDIEAIVDSL